MAGGIHVEAPRSSRRRRYRLCGLLHEQDVERDRLARGRRSARRAGAAAEAGAAGGRAAPHLGWPAPGAAGAANAAHQTTLARQSIPPLAPCPLIMVPSSTWFAEPIGRLSCFAAERRRRGQSGGFRGASNAMAAPVSPMRVFGRIAFVSSARRPRDPCSRGWGAGPTTAHRDSVRSSQAV